MTHTNEFLRGMFSAYMGCEMAMMPKSTRGYYMRGLLYPERVEFEHKGTMDDFNIRCFKPILTPLSEITDSDAVEVAKIGIEYAAKGFEVLKIKRHKKHISVEYRFIGSVVNNEDGFSYSAVGVGFNRDDFSVHQIDYLRSPYRPDGTPKPVYDLGYMHIQSLIKDGLAITR